MATYPQRATSRRRVSLSFLVAGSNDREDIWTHICMPSQGRDNILPCVVMRSTAKEAKLIQIRTFVGRSIQAKAASNRQRRSLFCQSMLCLIRSQRLGTDFAISSTSSLSSLFESSLFRSPSSSTLSSSLGSRDHCQGQKLRATIVKMVSREFESVRVEQNHCHGLQTVRASYWSQHHER